VKKVLKHSSLLLLLSFAAYLFSPATLLFSLLFTATIGFCFIYRNENEKAVPTAGKWCYSNSSTRRPTRIHRQWTCWQVALHTFRLSYVRLVVALHKI